jgi:hypothetical protein
MDNAAAGSETGHQDLYHASWYVGALDFASPLLDQEAASITVIPEKGFEESRWPDSYRRE